MKAHFDGELTISVAFNKSQQKLQDVLRDNLKKEFSQKQLILVCFSLFLV